MSIHTITVGGEQVEVHTMQISNWLWVASLDSRPAMGMSEQRAIDELQKILSDDIVTPDNPAVGSK